MPDDDERPEAEAAGPRSFWSGTLSFGLVSIPVALLPGSRTGRAALRMLDRDGTPVARRYYCPEDGQVLSNDDLVHGYELEDGRYVVLTDEELESADPKKSREIDLRLFVDERSVDPMYYDRPYFLVSAAESTKAYRLLGEVMERLHKVGVASFVMRDKEYLIAIRADNGVLRAETLRFSDEVRAPSSAGLEREGRTPPPERVEACLRAMEALAESGVDPDELTDEWSEGVRKLAEKKYATGVDVVEAREAPAEPAGEVIDLVKVLERSIKGAATDEKGGGPEREEPTAARHPRPLAKAKPRTDGERLEDLTKEELYARAQEQHIAGRTKMSKRQLVQALRKRA